MPLQKVLVTGVYGLIAGAIYQKLEAQSDKYDVYALARRRHPSDRAPHGRALEIPEDHFYLADLTDMEGVRKAVDGKELVVQMAADPRPDASWENVLSSNIIGLYNVFEASRQAGVKRIIYASSIMVSWSYQRDEPYKAIAEARFDDVPDPIPLVTRESLPRPSDLYSASKVWGEGLARTYSDIHGISIICLRIGWVNAEDHPQKPQSAAFWCSQRDVVQLVERCLEAPDSLRFDIFYAVSNNRYRWVDIERARQVVGYIPEDSAEERLRMDR